ncbi:YfhO family protein [Polaribacter sp.]|nr:YfhO family protein [Polaribacter sp.]MDB9748241.1 YfhO family protein [Polaribacter sp.]MDB9847902.1 YfhO family protein [Polaribacter sp.]MDC0087268.1 YfhO family protein [Polaribacter sp.]MDC1520054.1 YfhO family protein [Polaribacter sp.]
MNIKKMIPFAIAILVFSLAAITYFHPVLKGQKIAQSDITQFQGMSKEIQDFRAERNAEPYWTGSAFSGMPAYQLSAYYPNDFVRTIDQCIRFLPRPADYTFLYFISFFVLLLALKVDWKLALLGGLSFGFSTYLIIIFGAGHNAKAHAIGYMPLVLAGVLWVFQKKYLRGFVVTGLAMSLEIYTNHPQMTYYLGFFLLILGVVELVHAIKEKQLPTFAKQTAILLLAVFLGIAANAPRLMAMKEYADYSTRGSSELTIYPDGSPKIASTGLDYHYITEYSYAKLETFNLFIPRFMGGGTFEKLDENSAFYQLIAEKAGRKVADDYSERVLTYWGDQTIIEAPAYIGAVLFFLFFLGIFLVKGRLKQWLVAATVFSILMSWGRNFELLTHFFIDYVPLYNKFRAVSSIQVIAELCVPILSFLALKAFFSKAHTLKEKQEALKKAVYVFVGLIIVGFVSAHMFATFEGLRDQQQYNALPGLIDALIADRKTMLLTDTLRSLILTGVAAGTLWLLLKNTLKQTAVIIVFAVLLLFDLISIDKRYVNEADFNPARNIENPFVKTNADKLIQQDTTHYRVGNFTVDPMTDARTSYFHNSIGGYHAAKMGRYQELFEYQIAQRNMGVLDMLNTKYFLFSDDQGATQVQLNEAANGNAWFVENLKLVASANEEMQALDSLDSKNTAVLNRKDYETQFIANETLLFEKDSTATIQLKNYDVTTLTYRSNTHKEQFAVFSEIYYKEGWNAYIDGDLTPHFRVNYVLRGMKIPAGDHQVVFQFEPNVIKEGKIISLIAYGLLLLFPIGWFFYEKKYLK